MIRRMISVSVTCLGGGLLVTGCSIHRFAGAFKHSPDALERMSPGAQKLLEQLFEDIPEGRYVDNHMHVTGLPECGNGNLVDPHMRSIWHPFKRIKFAGFKSAAKVTDEAQADKQYVDRLVALARGVPGGGRFFILALDKFYTEDGKENLDKTSFYVPNDYMYSVAQAYPDIFEPIISIHPYRDDAIERLRFWHKKGIKVVKWLPNAQGMDPAHEKSVAFAKEMKALNMVLLTHTGREDAVDGREFQYLGNPLLVRPILDVGTTVIMAHCGSTGTSIDLDDPKNPKVGNFQLFSRMMDDPKYKDNLFADISATTQFNRKIEDMKILLRRQDWHPRLINGSDYPLPGINFLIQTRKLVKHKLLTPQEREWINEIYHYNPLLFDFAVKRCMKDPDTGKQYLPVVFTNPLGDRIPVTEP